MRWVLIFLLAISFTGCQKQVFLFKLFPYPETAKAFSTEWELLSDVRLTTSDKGAFSHAGNRTLYVKIKNQRGDLIEDFTKKYKGKYDFKIFGKWIDANHFRLRLKNTAVQTKDDVTDGIEEFVFIIDE